jgi:hypothetical protein
LNILRFIVILLLLSAMMNVFANFSVQNAKAYLTDEVYYLDADLDYALSEEAIKALHSGVILTLRLTIDIEREGFFGKRISRLKQRYTLEYSTLSEQYIVKYLNLDGLEEIFPNLESALQTLGEIRNLPLIDSSVIEPNETYWVRLRNYLDIEELPTALRLVAYFSAEWRLSADWFKCPLSQ